MQNKTLLMALVLGIASSTIFQTRTETPSDIENIKNTINELNTLTQQNNHSQFRIENKVDQFDKKLSTTITELKKSARRTFLKSGVKSLSLIGLGIGLKTAYDNKDTLQMYYNNPGLFFTQKTTLTESTETIDQKNYNEQELSQKADTKKDKKEKPKSKK